jgi:hypothetical protein
MSDHDDRLVDGQRIEDVLREDAELRERQAVERDETAFEHYLRSSFPQLDDARGGGAGTVPDDSDPSDDDRAIDAFVKSSFPGYA